MSDQPDRTETAVDEAGAGAPIPAAADESGVAPADPEATGSGSTGSGSTGSGSTGGGSTDGGSTGTTGSGSTGSGPDDEDDDDEGSLLDQEGDAAADYLEELLDIADLDGDIDIFEENGRASVAIVAEGKDANALKQLVGRDGAVLDALQELTRLAAQARTGERSRLLLDIGGWREGRRAEAAAVAKDAIERARSSGAPVDLDPMPAYQRKAVHDAVAAAGMRSESDGVEPSRYVVVHPA